MRSFRWMRSAAPMIGSTDVGDVSWVVPTVQARGATYAIGTPGHSWQLTAQGKMPAAHKGLVHVAKVMAGTALDAIQDETLLARAKADHQARSAGRRMCARCRPRSNRRSRCRRDDGVVGRVKCLRGVTSRPAGRACNRLRAPRALFIWYYCKNVL